MYIDIIYIWYTDVYGIGCDQNWVPQQWPQWPSSDQKKGRAIAGWSGGDTGKKCKVQSSSQPTSYITDHNSTLNYIKLHEITWNYKLTYIKSLGRGLPRIQTITACMQRMRWTSTSCGLWTPQAHQARQKTWWIAVNCCKFQIVYSHLQSNSKLLDWHRSRWWWFEALEWLAKIVFVPACWCSFPL